jgi:hypothetical protein
LRGVGRGDGRSDSTEGKLTIRYIAVLTIAPESTGKAVKLVEMKYRNVRIETAAVKYVDMAGVQHRSACRKVPDDFQEILRVHRNAMTKVSFSIFPSAEVGQCSLGMSECQMEPVCPAPRRRSDTGPMGWHRYRFHSTWYLTTPPDSVYRVLERLDEYPHWWPQVSEVRQTGETTGVLRFRSFLPFDLVVTAHVTRHDPARRLLEAAIAGDLEGWVRWTIRTGRGARRAELRFEEEAVVRKPLLRALAVPGRPFALANHAWMVHRGLGGLRARLAEETGGAVGTV